MLLYFRGACVGQELLVAYRAVEGDIAAELALQLFQIVYLGLNRIVAVNANIDPITYDVPIIAAGMQNYKFPFAFRHINDLFQARCDKFPPNLGTHDKSTL